MTPKNIALLRIFCVLIILAIAFSIVVHSKQLNKDKCVVKFTTNYQNGQPLLEPLSIEVKITDLYNNLTLNKCIVKWDDGIGYFLDKSG